MIKNLFNKIKRLNNNTKLEYLRYLKKDIDEKLFLFEGGQGTNINGNMFSLLNELKSNPKYKDYRAVFVVAGNKSESARERMKFYGFDDVIITVRNSNEYCKYLATAKYLATDNSFPPYFNKRDGQVFLNTWHGTPLKTLGKSDKSNMASLANIQKNYLMSDYALFPNQFTRDVFMNDYDLKNLFTGYSFIANYPRNYIFYDKQQSVEMKSRLGLSSKQAYAYMPTWRGTGRKADTKHQIEETVRILTEIDERFNDDQVLLVNLHFLLSAKIDCTEFKHIQSFPTEYDTYEVLNACDGLITDYSSVFFDFAVTGKKIILYAYDKEDYLLNRGTYIPFDELPFPICENIDELLEAIEMPYSVDKEFLRSFCPNGWRNSCEKILDLMITGETECYQLEKQENANKDICLLYAGTLPDTHFKSIKKYIEDNPDYNYVIAYRQNFNKNNKEFVLSLDNRISTFGILNAFQFKPLEFLSFIIHWLFRIKNNNRVLNEFFSREAERLFYKIKPVKVVDYSCCNTVMSGVLSKLDGKKELVIHGKYYCLNEKLRRREKYVKAYELNNGFEENDLSKIENEWYVENSVDDLADETFRKNSKMKNILPIYFNSKNKMICISFFTLKTPVKTRIKDTFISVGEENFYEPFFICNRLNYSKCHFGIYVLSVPVEDVLNMPSTNMVALCYKNRFNKLVQCHILYCSLLYGLFLGLRGPIMKHRKTDTVAIFRQSKNNRLNIYVRSWIKSDEGIEHLKQDLAFLLGLFWHSRKSRQLVLLYEKNSSKYEESASVLYEALMDKGYKYAYFIVDRNYEFIDKIPEKYRSNILYKHSFKHYLYFFKSKTFIGTEQIVHAIDLKIFNVLALRKIADKSLNFVFLQHGVMYMVSLDSESRGMFKRKKLNKYRVVVSSQLEADHFTQLGRHKNSDLYICGLPKFDRNILLPDADKIVIMPTWRPWEINLARDDFENTAYFKMVMKIYNSVPEKLKDKVIILPHPLIINELSHIDSDVADKMIIDARYDDILKQTRLLITDYSSIAYDAFYRGARVIFYWEEKDYCMMQYGPTTKLMLNEDNVYGDYFYNTDGLSEAIEYNYYNEQTDYYRENYKKIVQFDDGKNTERLIDFLIEDGIINL